MLPTPYAGIGEGWIVSAINLDALTASVLSGDPLPLENLARSIGADRPRVLFDPPETAIASDRLRSLYRHWTGMPRGPRLPLTRAIDGAALGPALGIVMLLEPLANPFEFRYRLYGSEIAAVSSLEMSGRTTAAIPSPEMRAFFQATYAAAMRSGRPLLSFHQPPPEIGIISWCRLILPCEDGSAGVDRLLVGNEPAMPSLVRQRPWPPDV